MAPHEGLVTSRSSKFPSSPAAVLVSGCPGGPGDWWDGQSHLRAGQDTLRFALGSVGSSSSLLAQVCCAAQKLLWCLQAKTVVSERGTVSPLSSGQL